MSDEIAPAVDEAEVEPVSPAPEDESTPAEESAAAEDKPEAEDVEAEDEGKEAETAKGRSAAFQKLLDKYGGDEEALANAYFEQANSSSRLHQEIQEIKEMLASGRAQTQEEESQALAQDPYVQEIHKDLQSTSEEAQSVLQQQKGMVSEYQKLERKIAQLEGEYKRADEAERMEVAQELAEAKKDMKDLSRDYRETQRDLARLNGRWKDLQRGLREAEGRAKSLMERDRQEALRVRQEANETRNEYNSTLRAEASKYGIDPSSKTYNVLNETVRSRLYLHMQALRQQGVTEGIDIPEAVSSMMEEYAEAMGLKRQTLKTVAKEKLGTLTAKKVEGAPTLTDKAPSKDKRMSAADWKARARRLMP